MTSERLRAIYSEHVHTYKLYNVIHFTFAHTHRVELTWKSNTESFYVCYSVVDS